MIAEERSLSFENFFKELTMGYFQRNDNAQRIIQLLEKDNEKISIDHVTFRTVNLPKINIENIAKIFFSYGYKEMGQYYFPTKKLNAKHYEHADACMPKIFISELQVSQFSQALQKTFKNLIRKIPETLLKTENLFNGIFWAPLSYKTYQELWSESEYAAWVYAFGFCINHMTIEINAFKKYDTIDLINEFVLSHHIPMNLSGGIVKGTPKEHLVQSNTLAEMTKITFAEGQFEIPGGDIGFAKRYQQANGKLYTGFVATSADKMFESS